MSQLGRYCSLIPGLDVKLFTITHVDRRNRVQLVDEEGCRVAVQNDRELPRDGNLGLARAIALGELGSPNLQP